MKNMNHLANRPQAEADTAKGQLTFFLFVAGDVFFVVAYLSSYHEKAINTLYELA